MQRAQLVVVLAGGDHVDQFVPSSIAGADLRVAADSGLDLAERLGLAVDRVVGDLDSVSAEALDRARTAGVTIDEHPADKDETDLELALAFAASSAGDGRIVVLGGAGGRLDHLLANHAVLTSARWKPASLTAYVGTSRVDVIHDRRSLRGSPDWVVSLLAWHGPAAGVTTAGLRWPLADATIEAGSAYGTSNEFLDDEATVSVRSGVLTATTEVDTSIEAGEVIR